MTLNKSLNIALPKGRILDSVLPILLKVGIEPEKSFFDRNNRKLKFKTNIDYIDIQMVSLIQIISALLNIITWLVIIDVVMSLLIQFRILDQRNQIVSQIWLSIRNVLEPLYSRIRSFLPNTIGFDLAPAILLFGIFALQTIIRNNFNHY